VKLKCYTFTKLDEAVKALVPQYKRFFTETDSFMDENPEMPVEDILNIMDSFVLCKSNYFIAPCHTLILFSLSGLCLF
jgi:hypothetical protein